MRKCRLASCRAELPPTKKSDFWQKKGFCNLDHITEHGMVKARAILEKQEKEKGREAKREKREYYRKDLKWQHSQCKPAFNRMRVLQELEWFHDRGMEPTCISCGNPLGNDVWCCGHMKTVGAQSGIRYDRANTYLQHNVRCNMNLSGDISGTKTTRGYKAGLVERFGVEEAERIVAYCDSKSAPVKWDWEQLEEWRKEWRIEIRRIEKKLCL